MTSPIEPTAPASSASPAAPTRHTLRFTGTAGEYFRIWIVNLCLTIVTLGLYGPWATVRTRKYFYGNLVLDGASFAYDADPKRILVGRLIVLAFGAGIALLQAFAPIAGAFATLALIPLMPWLMVRSLAFHRRSSSYRNVRFAFRATTGEAARVLFGGVLLAMITLGLGYPWYFGRFHEFQVANSRFGTTPFSFDWRAGQYYRVVGLALVWAVGLGAAATLAVSSIGAAVGGLGLSEGALVGMFVGYAAAIAVFQAGFTNLFFANAALGPHVRFASSVRALGLVRVYGVGALAVIASAGLALPWLLVRAARYRAEQTTVIAASPLDEFAQGAAAPDAGAGAIAEEASSGFFDFDFGL